MARKVDELGRLVLPSELRRRFRIREGDYLGIQVEDERIILTKEESACVFCNGFEGLREFRGKLVCPECLAALRVAEPKPGPNSSDPLPGEGS